ncbi:MULTISPECIES: GMC family oxidoreductase N-terminal domain-containing protein [Brevibacterium]|uniref:Choline oxidase n=2 Tax=Brevibacterium antiquum TaxID=234835 RepID=A0A2H1HJS7_9MICO|nr:MULTISPECIES: GMC family oxidoreductase N-terminal domain-containing protein [Brevibacterium]SMX63116.1 choline oxidase [Brevibacterium antiquum CNRZ 918]SMY03171.1 choline oxidase [Brevibacterium antiquum]HCG57446.1 choline oxidase [Brevibacterium sp.]
METTHSFDYVVVGGGSAGAAVAARLSEDPEVSVGLLEAGPTDVGQDMVLRLNRWMELLESGFDWDYPIEKQEHGNSFMRHARAKVLGGCSSHNSCIAFWAPREDLDDWETKFGATGWGSKDTFGLYKKLETNELPGDHHGHDGPVHLMNVPPADPCGIALLDACEQEGIPRVQFNEGETVINGANFFQVNRKADGTRSSSSVSYLHPILHRENLTILTDTQAKELEFDAEENCTGVLVVNNAFGHTKRIEAKREVIVSSGAINTPQLLMLSGIGPKDHLAEVGVDVRVDSPGVGEHLQDHPEGVISWEAKKPMVEDSTQWWEAGIFTPTEEGLDRPDLMMHYGSVPFDMHTLRQGYPTAENTFCLTPNVTHARSRGTVRLRSCDFRDKPLVDPRYFTDPEGHDMRVMIAGIRKARAIVSQDAMSEWAGEELFPGKDVQTDAQIEDYITRTHNTVYHPVGTTRMGAADDQSSPLDPQLRVKGVNRLRVVDASAMPEITTVNPNITVMMMGEKCAEMIKAGN